MYKKPLIEIKKIFQEPRHITSFTDLSRYDNLKDVIEGITELENESRSLYGLPQVNELHALGLGEKRKKVQESMKRNKKWQALCQKAISLSGAEYSLYYKDTAEKIYLPDWNDMTAVLYDIRIGNNEIITDFDIAHTYVIQLYRKNLLSNYAFKPVSVYGNFYSSEGRMMIGVRGGMSSAGYHMTIPAGSLYLTEKDGKICADPIEGLKKEMRDETGLERDYSIEGIIGVFEDPTLCGLVFDVVSNKTEDKLREIWETDGNKEHTEIFFLPREYMHSYISKYADKRHGIMPDVNKERSLHPSGTAVLLVGLKRYSEKSFDETIKGLGGLFSAKGSYYVK
ncbi:MAG TPA: hypothetical protein VJB11_01185 [archaeon]|nr:hypothetical protein [archaeon]